MNILGRRLKSQEEKIYGLIGYPLSHSFSQMYFNQKFQAEHINARYVNFEIPDIGALMEVFAENHSLSGLNVTRPYKEQVIPYLQGMSDRAARVGAVNVIKIEPGKSDNDFRLIGYNSDVAGFVNSLQPLLRPCHKAALVLGSGGASKAVCCGLEDLGIVPQVVSRNPGENMIAYSDLTPEMMEHHKLIVNTTPLGMYPHTDECPDIPYELLNSDFLCYDLIYNPDITLFMKKSHEHGAEVKNGLEMLLLQAFESWEIWTGHRK